MIKSIAIAGATAALVIGSLAIAQTTTNPNPDSNPPASATNPNAPADNNGTGNNTNPNAPTSAGTYGSNTAATDNGMNTNNTTTGERG